MAALVKMPTKRVARAPADAGASPIAMSKASMLGKAVRYVAAVNETRDETHASLSVFVSALRQLTLDQPTPNRTANSHQIIAQFRVAPGIEATPTTCKHYHTDGARTQTFGLQWYVGLLGLLGAKGGRLVDLEGTGNAPHSKEALVLGPPDDRPADDKDERRKGSTKARM